MTIILVLANHGVPSIDFPPQERAEFFNLLSRFEHSGHDPLSKSERAHSQELKERYLELDMKMHAWPFGKQDIARFLSEHAQKHIEPWSS